MKKIKCPFEEFLDQEMDLYTIFDTASIQPDCLKKVMRVLKYICMHKGEKASEIILKIVKANITDKGFEVIKEYYINNYKEKTHTFDRLVYVKDEEDIKHIMQSFTSIETIYDVLAACPLQFK